MKTIKQLLTEIDTDYSDFMWTEESIKRCFDELGLNKYYDIDYERNVIKIEFGDKVVGDELMDEGGIEEAQFYIKGNSLVIQTDTEGAMWDLHITLNTLVKETNTADKYDVNSYASEKRIYIDIIPN